MAKSGHIKKIQSDESYSYIVRKVWYHQILNSNLLCFHCAHPNQASNIYKYWSYNGNLRVIGYPLLNKPCYLNHLVKTHTREIFLWITSNAFIFCFNHFLETSILLTSSNNQFSEFQISNIYDEIFVLIFLMILRTHFEASLRFRNNLNRKGCVISIYKLQSVSPYCWSSK